MVGTTGETKGDRTAQGPVEGGETLPQQSLQPQSGCRGVREGSPGHRGDPAQRPLLGSREEQMSPGTQNPEVGAQGVHLWGGPRPPPAFRESSKVPPLAMVPAGVPPHRACSRAGLGQPQPHQLHSCEQVTTLLSLFGCKMGRQSLPGGG